MILHSGSVGFCSLATFSASISSSMASRRMVAEYKTAGSADTSHIHCGLESFSKEILPKTVFSIPISICHQKS